MHVPTNENLMLVWSELKPVSDFKPTDGHRIKKFSENMHARNWRK